MTLDKKVKLVQLEYRFYKTFTKQYWFTSILLLPFYIYAVFYMLFKARTFMFFTAINPSLRYGGMCTSKFDLLNQVHKKYLPTGVVLPQNTSKALVLELGICHHGASCVGLNHLITNELNQLFDDVSKTIDRFDVGRYDVKAENYGELLKGNFKVIEINGTDAVPLHIFDKTLMYHSVISDLVKHWQNLLKIAINNHKMGMKYAHFFPVLKEIYQNGSFDKVT